jgi:hypothetical protein
MDRPRCSAPATSGRSGASGQAAIRSVQYRSDSCPSGERSSSASASTQSRKLSSSSGSTSPGSWYARVASAIRATPLGASVKMLLLL